MTTLSGPGDGHNEWSLCFTHVSSFLVFSAYQLYLCPIRTVLLAHMKWPSTIDLSTVNSHHANCWCRSRPMNLASSALNYSGNREFILYQPQWHPRALKVSSIVDPPNCVNLECSSSSSRQSASWSLETTGLPMFYRENTSARNLSQLLRIQVYHLVSTDSVNQLSVILLMILYLTLRNPQ
jgi:hypothetical protein